MVTLRPRGGRLLLAVVCALAPAGMTGCTGEFKRVPVTGAATLDGKPFTGGVLNFAPDAAKGNAHRVACVSPVRDGKFGVMTSAVHGKDSGSGAPVGWYKVYLNTEFSGTDLKIHPRFLDPHTSPILIEVVDAPAPGAYDITFTSK